jgi:very-short-patch-repair endonuclease
MREPFIGSEALADDRLTRYALRSRYVAIHPDVYIASDIALSAVSRAQAAWLWSRRRGVVAGQSASALHGAKWVDNRAPAELLYPYRRPPKTIRTWSDCLDADEIETIAGMRVTTPARTALDLARRYPVGKAVAAIDSLTRATHLKLADVDLLAERYSGSRGIRRARHALKLSDPGAESPRETWLRLLLVRVGFPRPRTQIPVYDLYGQIVAVVDMGWEDIKLAVEYEGDHHRTDRRQFNKDIRRAEALAELGWAAVRVTAEDTEAGVIGRVEAAWARRTCTEGGIAPVFSPSVHARRDIRKTAWPLTAAAPATVAPPAPTATRAPQPGRVRARWRRPTT